MSGAALLAVLDAALTEAASDRTAAAGPDPSAGLAAAVALNALLIRHGLGWDDAMQPGSRLSKLCGHLGSDFAAEREAAYAHAVRHIMRARTTWSALVSLPPALAVVAEPHARPQPVQSVISAPEGDWLTTVRGLRARSAWRSDAERDTLDRIEASLVAGEPLSAESIKRVGDVWWDAELHVLHLDEAVF